MMSFMDKLWLPKPTNSDLFVNIGTGTHIKTREPLMPINIPISHLSGHLLVAATTRQGKTRLAQHMARQYIRKGLSVIALEPKGDNEFFSSIVEEAYACGRENELIYTSPIWPQFSAKIDPLSHYRMPEELVGHITSGVPSGGGDVFFANVAYELSVAVVASKLALARFLGTRSNFNLMDVMEYISQDALRDLYAQLGVIDNLEARQLRGMLEKIIQSPIDYFSKISSTLRTTLVELCAGNIGQLVGTADSNTFIDRLERGERVIMVVQLGSMITQKAAYTVGKVIISMIRALAGRYLADYRKIDPPLCVIIDEASTVFHHGFEWLMSMGGGAGVYMHLLLQSFSQVFSAMGKDAGQTILDCVNTMICMREPDPQTAKLVAEHFGVRNYLSPIIQSNSSDLSFREVEEGLLRPHDILTLQPQMFYMKTYSGNFQGLTAPSPPPRHEIRFPQGESRQST